MMSIAKILIVITATVAISGEVLVESTNRFSTRISRRDEMLDTLPRLKRIVPSYDEADYVKTISINNELLSSIEDEMRNKKPDFSKNERLSKPKPVINKTKRSDDGADGGASSPPKKRFRRSSELNTPSNNNTTVKSTTLVNIRTQKISKNQRLLFMILTALTTPYVVIVPNKDFEYREDFYA